MKPHSPWRPQQKQLRRRLWSDFLQLAFNGHFLGVILYFASARWVMPPWKGRGTGGLGLCRRPRDTPSDAQVSGKRLWKRATVERWGKKHPRSKFDPRGPNAVCEPIPPNAPARSAAFPLCNSTTTIRNKQTKTCTIVNNV